MVRDALLALLGLMALGPLAIQAIPKEQLYPYTGFGTSVLEADSEGQLLSVEVALKTPIVFYDQTYDTIFVNGNGALTFLMSMQRFINIPFPLDYPVISPLYTRVDIRSSGNVYWGEVDAPGILTRSSDTIRAAFAGAQDFVPSHVFLVTWVDVGYFDAKKDKVNTFQVIISSNGTRSYVELLYPDGGIQWIQGDSNPNGLPDAKAQAGFAGRDGRMFTLKGSGTDQIQNIEKWSNVNKPGQWLFQIGPIPNEENVKFPDNIDDLPTGNDIPSCVTSATSCHSKAICLDYEGGFCCACREGFFGNGKSCQPNDIPLRVIGKVSGSVNGESFPERDLQCYVQTKDGRTYTAMSRVPEFVGSSSQLLSILGGILGWLFAKPIGNTKNGYELTGGVFNHSAELIFASSGDKVTIHSNYLGLNVFGQLKMEAEVSGTLPHLADDAKVDYGDHEEVYIRTKPGLILSDSSRSYKLDGAPGVDYPFSQKQVIQFEECQYAPSESTEETSTTRLKFSRGLTSFEAREQIIRFAMNTKVVPLDEEDPCVRGSLTCGDHSSCVVDGDEFRCVCIHGYQSLQVVDGSANCVDIDECKAGTHMCPPETVCVNHEGSHSCPCREGFIMKNNYCERLPSCEDTECGDFAECTMVDGEPVCSCSDGYERQEQGCYRIQYVSCDVNYDCSPNGTCTYDAAREMNICVCLPGFIGDGHTCVSEPESTTPYYSTEEQVGIQCDSEKCWCDPGWDLYNNTCIEREDISGVDIDIVNGTTDKDDNKDLLARPLPECLENNCVCPWGYDYKYEEEICVPQPGYNHETMGPSGTLSCNVVNQCHPYAQCIFIAQTGDYECQCNPGYDGDGLECTRSVSCNVVNQCHPYAQCISIAQTGGYECQCNPGYDGDGLECTTTEVSCVDADICDPNATCRSNGTVATCICNPGYEGDGSICRSIDACSSDEDCGSNEQCSYVIPTSRYECACSPGHSRVDGQCVIAGCSNDPGKCHVNGHCVMTADEGFKCVCIEGYHGDGIDHCIESQVGCNVINNCGRDAACGFNEATANYACRCKSGFYGDGFTCLPESSCKRDPSLCSPNANCILAGENQFACVCNQGYVGDGADCRAVSDHDSNILLINQGMATLRIPFFPTPENQGSLIQLAYKQLALALDIDCVAGKAYSGDIAGNQITSLEYNGSALETFIDDVSSPEGISIDWVSRNIFWTDSSRETIEVASLETKKRKVLINEGLVNPRGIAVHPYRGKIFWSDWNRLAPRLEWANEDGTERAIFVQGESVELPNSLAIDWSTDEICWADAGIFAINCANIDTRAVRAVAKELSYPFGLGISQNHYYWTDWKTLKIEVASKNSGLRNKAIDIPPGGSGRLYGIVAVPESCPRVSNVCQYENGRCNQNQLCLPDGQGGRTCACADNVSGPCEDSRYPS